MEARCGGEAVRRAIDSLLAEPSKWSAGVVQCVEGRTRGDWQLATEVEGDNPHERMMINVEVSVRRVVRNLVTGHWHLVDSDGLK